MIVGLFGDFRYFRGVGKCEWKYVFFWIYRSFFCSAGLVFRLLRGSRVFFILKGCKIEGI